MRNPLEKLPVAELLVWDKQEQRHVTVLVDGDYDGEYLSYYKWCVNPGGYVIMTYLASYEYDKTGKRIRLSGTKNPYLHHLVLPPKKGYWVHHINGNKLDNRSANLEYRTPQYVTQKREDTLKANGGRHPRLQDVCKRGHKMEGDNIYVIHKGNGTVVRLCRACAFIRKERYLQGVRLKKWEENRA